MKTLTTLSPSPNRQAPCAQAPALFARFGVSPPRGVLLWGPPGTGKTGLARAAAADARARLFVLNGPDVVSEFYGDSEAGLLVNSLFPNP